MRELGILCSSCFRSDTASDIYGRCKVLVVLYNKKDWYQALIQIHLNKEKVAGLHWDRFLCIKLNWNVAFHLHREVSLWHPYQTHEPPELTDSSPSLFRTTELLTLSLREKPATWLGLQYHPWCSILCSTSHSSIFSIVLNYEQDPEIHELRDLE